MSSKELDALGLIKKNLKMKRRCSLSQVRPLSCIATSVLRMRLLHVVEFSKKLRWLAQTKVITLKMQLHAINANVKQLSQLSYKLRCDEHFMHAFSKKLHWLIQTNVITLKT